MAHKYLIYLLLFLISLATAFAQERKDVLGKIVSKSRDLEGVYIENISSRKSVTTEKGGYFKIAMKANDTLIFASVNLKGIKRIVKESDFSKKLLFVPMEMASTTLDELVIDRRITSESLGIAAKKRYTPAEKRLHTATSSGGGIIAIDAVVNALSGRTAMLKKALEYEQQETVVKKIINSFEEDFFVKQLRIPKQNIEGFGYYLAQDNEILRAIATSNKDQLKFMLSEKSAEFIELIKVLQ